MGEGPGDGAAAARAAKSAAVRGVSRDLVKKANSLNVSYYQSVTISVCVKPVTNNMNAYAERLVGTVRREALDHFLLFSKKQVRNIVSELVGYYNNQRVHQGTDKIPDAEIGKSTGNIMSCRYYRACTIIITVQAHRDEKN